MWAEGAAVPGTRLQGPAPPTQEGSVGGHLVLEATTSHLHGGPYRGLQRDFFSFSTVLFLEK